MPRVTVEYDLTDLSTASPETRVRVEVEAPSMFTALHDAAEGAMLQVLEGMEVKLGLTPGELR